MSEAVRVEGATKLRKELKALDAALPKELAKVGKDAAELVAETARVEAPRRSGKLEGSIKALGLAKGGAVRAGGGSIEYARPIHFGWPGHGIEPHPFLYEALDTRRGEVIDRYAAGVADLIDRTITPGTGGL